MTLTVLLLLLSQDLLPHDLLRHALLPHDWIHGLVDHFQGSLDWSQGLLDIFRLSGVDLRQVLGFSTLVAHVHGFLD